MHGAEMWKSNHGGFLNTAGKLSTKNNGFELQHTACQNCGKQTNCPICRCTDASLELDFQTGMFDSLKKIYNNVAHSENAKGKNYEIDKAQRATVWTTCKKNLCTLFKDSGEGACTSAFTNALSLENMEAPWHTEHVAAANAALTRAQEANKKIEGV
jgi:hypothetical protein